ncbi:MAG: dihydroorotase, partial [Clostridiales bacterium]|nr:dihydroorotase [Clostridiales bacterium]
LSDMDGISNCAVAFSDDGVGVQSADIMEKAMIKAKALGKIIAAHCEVDNLLHGGCVHDGEYAKLHELKGIPSESEWREVERDIKIVRRTGCDYHVCHVSTKESVELIRKAKAEGLPVTCETAPHYLVLCDTDMEDDGRFKMNPPLRSREDRAALIDAIKDGTIDMIATDHAPHSKEEKSGGLKNSLNGIAGLETAFPVLYTKLVKSGIITLEKLLELMQVNPSKRFGIGSPIKKGSPADLTVFNLDEEYIIDPDDFLSKGRATPFKGDRVFGRCKLTMVGGIPVWKE